MVSKLAWELAWSLYRLVPPGAVGGMYGSGCFQLSSSFSVSDINAWSLLSTCCSVAAGISTRMYPLVSDVRHGSVCLEQRSDIQRLPAPEMAMDRPVECQLQRAAIE